MTPTPERIRVLVVEDDAVYQHLIIAWLHQGDEFETATAASLHEAHQRIDEGEFDAVLLDLNLEDSSGLDTLETLQALAPGVPVVILTGMEDEAQGVAAVKAGAQEYLTKSGVGPDDLKQELRIAVARARAEGERLGAVGRDIEQRLRDQLDEEKTRFYRAAARSLRDPLDVIQAHLDRLRGDLNAHLRPDHEEVFEEVRGHLEHLRALADDLEHVAGLKHTVG